MVTYKDCQLKNAVVFVLLRIFVHGPLPTHCLVKTVIIQAGVHFTA
jgi:hypothetical protein